MNRPERGKRDNTMGAFVTSRLDYGNALLIGLPRDQINKLQRIQNMAARVITFTPRRDHITPVLKDLHWLPVKCRIEYKILLHVYRCLNGMAPLYLANLLKRQSPGRTRSSEQHLLDIPRTKLASFGDRSFRVMGPRLWNALPIVIKCCGTLSAFRKALKTHIFKAYVMRSRKTLHMVHIFICLIVGLCYSSVFLLSKYVYMSTVS